MDSALFLCVQSSAIPAKVFTLKPGTFVFGRSSSCDFVLNDSTVSRRHAEITFKHGQVTVRDLHSSNGTFVEGRRVDKSTVSPGAQMRLGQASVVLATADHDSETPDSCVLTAKPGAESAIADVPNVRDRLSEAQYRVFNLLLRGLTEKEIGQRLHISWRTVHNHANEIHRILGVHSGKELLVRFLRPTGSESTQPNP